MIVIVRIVGGTAGFAVLIEALFALASGAPDTKWDTPTIMRFVIPGIAACAAGAWTFIDRASARHDAELRGMTDDQRAERDNDRAW